MVFGPIVGSVERPRSPVVSELALGVTAPLPVESHVHRFGATWLNVVRNNAVGSAVVGLYGHGRLLVAHFLKEVSHWDCSTGVDVKGAEFGFGCT